MSVNTPSLFDMNALEPQVQVGLMAPFPSECQDSELLTQRPAFGELVFDKFVPRDEPVVKQEEQVQSLSLALGAASASAASSADLQDSVGDFFSSADSTPLFELESLQTSPHGWDPLFNDDIPINVGDSGAAAAEVAEVSEASVEPSRKPSAAPLAPADAFLPTPVIEDAHPFFTSKTKRKSSSAVHKPDRFDRLGVISYNRKMRSVPLTPVVPESNDPVAQKRARNTEAARRSRARKLQRMNQLELKVEELLQRNAELENEITRLKSAAAL
ncbi:LAMI_0E05424g1_1 [Lachancea mirantina]|uniref:LAMI_0E05424g1_1 n=1 Tax=Lachancea mirantina TaxID=1230905 RepID=A0A1G4JLL9_9SACH|nr:LAMI_0E05424g1_1 [Lachancea mirantina]